MLLLLLLVTLNCVSLFFRFLAFVVFFVVKRNFHAPRSETVSWAQSRLRGQKQRRVAHIVVVVVTAVLVAYIVVAAANIHIYVAAVLVVVADLLLITDALFATFCALFKFVASVTGTALLALLAAVHFVVAAVAGYAYFVCAPKLVCRAHSRTHSRTPSPPLS